MPYGPSFDIELKENVNLVWEMMQKKSPELGITFIGNEREGRFFGNGIVGHYTVKGNVLTITITVLGFPASEIYTEHTIKETLRRFFLSVLSDS